MLSIDLQRIRPAQRRSIALMFARAFQQDPLLCYAFPEPHQRKQMLPWLIGLNVRYGDLFGEVWTTSAFDGAATWLPPTRTTLSPWRIVRAGMFAAPLRVRWPVLRRLARVERIVESLHRQYASSSHWYLSQLGVDPAHQGQGIGSALLRPMLSRLDEQGLACYLETMNAVNVPFYQRRGFRVVAQENLPGGGPSVWAMLRSPSPSPQ